MVVTKETLRQGVYSAIRTLLVANKPTYDYGEDTFTYSIVSEYGRQNSEFPYIVMNKAEISPTLLSISGEGEIYEISVQLDFYALGKHRKVAIDAGLDSVQNTIIDNQSSLQSTDGLLLMAEPFDESNTTPFNDNQQLLNTASMILKLKLQ